MVFTLMKVLRKTVDDLKALNNGDGCLCASIATHVPYVWADLIDDAQISCNLVTLFFTCLLSSYKLNKVALSKVPFKLETKALMLLQT